MQYENKYQIKCGLDVDFVIFPGLSSLTDELLNKLNNLTDEYHCGFMIEDKCEEYRNYSGTYYNVPVIGIYYEEDNYEFNEKLLDLCREYCETSSWII